MLFVHLNHHICARPQGVSPDLRHRPTRDCPHSATSAAPPPSPLPVEWHVLWQSLSAYHLFLVLLTLPIFLHLDAQNESIFSPWPKPPPSHPSPLVHSSPWSYRRQGSWVLIWFHSCYCLLLLLPTFIWVDLMRRWTDNLMTRWGDLSAIPPQEFRRSTGAFASSAMKSARSCSEYICHSANKCLQG